MSHVSSEYKGQDIAVFNDTLKPHRFRDDVTGKQHDFISPNRWGGDLGDRLDSLSDDAVFYMNGDVLRVTENKTPIKKETSITVTDDKKTKTFKIIETLPGSPTKRQKLRAVEAIKGLFGTYAKLLLGTLDKNSEVSVGDIKTAYASSQENPEYLVQLCQSTWTKMFRQGLALVDEGFFEGGKDLETIMENYAGITVTDIMVANNLVRLKYGKNLTDGQLEQLLYNLDQLEQVLESKNAVEQFAKRNDLQEFIADAAENVINLGRHTIRYNDCANMLFNLRHPGQTQKCNKLTRTYYDVRTSVNFAKSFRDYMKNEKSIEVSQDDSIAFSKACKQLAKLENYENAKRLGEIYAKCLGRELPTGNQFEPFVREALKHYYR